MSPRLVQNVTVQVTLQPTLPEGWTQQAVLESVVEVLQTTLGGVRLQVTLLQ